MGLKQSIISKNKVMAQPEQIKSNPLAVYDFTMPSDGCTIVQLKDFLVKYAKNWVFQLEQGHETGYKHYQGKLSLQTKKRVSTMIALVNKELPGMHISPTVTQNMGNEFYVTKEDTRIDGPWSNKDVKIPSHLVETPKWYPWQQWIIDHLNVYEPRTVNVVYDPHGNTGKTHLALWLSVRGLARKIPILNDAKDISRFVLDTPTAGCYFADMPRASDKKHLKNFYAAIEDIKNGYAYDDRYKFQEKYFERPQVWIFSNALPDFELLSKDRWRVWQVNAQTLSMSMM